MKVIKEFRIEIGCFLTVYEGDEEEYPKLGKLVSKLEELIGESSTYLTPSDTELLIKHTWDNTVNAWKVR